MNRGQARAAQEAEIQRLKASDAYRSEVARCAGRTIPSVAEPAPLDEQLSQAKADLVHRRIAAAIRRAGREQIIHRHNRAAHPYALNVFARARDEDWPPVRLATALKPYV